MERDPKTIKGIEKPLDFNSHAHVERDADFPRLAEWIDHFNSHAHVERDHLTLKPHRFMTISTHTLTWSVTVSIPMTGNDSAFQLTRSRGA